MEVKINVEDLGNVIILDEKGRQWFLTLKQDNLEQLRESEWATGLKWICEEVDIKTERIVKNRILYPYRSELESFVDYPDNGGRWRFHVKKTREWLNHNFKKGGYKNERKEEME